MELFRINFVKRKSIEYADLSPGPSPNQGGEAEYFHFKFKVILCRFTPLPESGRGGRIFSF
jgi:hypothetical protein